MVLLGVSNFESGLVDVGFWFSVWDIGLMMDKFFVVEVSWWWGMFFLGVRYLL